MEIAEHNRKKKTSLKPTLVIKTFNWFIVLTSHIKRNMSVALGGIGMKERARLAVFSMLLAFMPSKTDHDYNFILNRQI